MLARARAASWLCFTAFRLKVSKSAGPLKTICPMGQSHSKIPATHDIRTHRHRGEHLESHAHTGEGSAGVTGPAASDQKSARRITSNLLRFVLVPSRKHPDVPSTFTHPRGFGVVTSYTHCRKRCRTSTSRLVRGFAPSSSLFSYLPLPPHHPCHDLIHGTGRLNGAGESEMEWTTTTCIF